MDIKRCNKCKQDFPSTSEYFDRDKKKKDGLSTTCKQCMKEYNARRYQEKKDEIKVQNREYYDNNKEKYKPLFKENHHRWYKDNIDEYNRNSIKWREEHSEYFKEYHKNYFKENPEKTIEASKRRVERMKLQPYTLTTKQWKYIKAKFNNCCAYCGQEIPLQQEHFIPVASEGAYTIDNIIPACKRCNAKKHDSDYFEWYPKQEFYSEERMGFLLNHLENIELEWEYINNKSS